MNRGNSWHNCSYCSLHPYGSTFRQEGHEANSIAWQRHEQCPPFSSGHGFFVCVFSGAELCMISVKRQNQLSAVFKAIRVIRSSKSVWIFRWMGSNLYINRCKNIDWRQFNHEPYAACVSVRQRCANKRMSHVEGRLGTAPFEMIWCFWNSINNPQ